MTRLRPGLTFALLLLTACAAEIDRNGRSSAAEADVSTLRIYYQGNETVFGPADWVSYRHIVFASLFRTGPDGEVGWLVDRWEVSDDGRSWTYHLHPEARWHDGVPVTTADIEYSLDLLNRGQDPDGELDLPYALEVIDDHTFSITYDNVRTRDYFHFDVICFPRHHLEALDPSGFWDWEFWTRPVGNGPFRYVTHIPGVMTELEADPHYFLEGPAIQRLIVRYGGEPTVELLAGNVDLHIWGTPDQRRTVESYPRLDFYADPQTPDVLFWNVGIEPFSDVRVRRALTLAIDRRSLGDAAGVPDSVPIVDGPADYRNVSGYPEPMPFDPREALRLLAEAGWRDTDGDGLLDRAGQPLRFELLTHHPRQEIFAIVIQSQLRTLGVDVELRTLERLLVKRLVSTGEFEAAISFGRYLQQNLYLVDREDPAAVESPIGYDDTELLEVWNAANYDFTPGAAKRSDVRTWEILQRDVPATFLVPNLETVIFDRRIRGAKPFHGMQWLDELWIEEEE